MKKSNGIDKALLRKAQEETNGGGTWKPLKKGDYIGGRIVSLKEVQGKYGPQTVMIVETSDGPRTVYANASMKRGLDENGAKPGKKVAVVYQGDVKTGKGRPFRLFGVAVS